MSELLQEFVDSGSHRLRVDREQGVIRGVKLLGLSSRNGRRYREAALIEAIGLYEGAKVNVNHPKGHPLSPRDYQDRLGIVRGVQFRTGEGLFGDLHFNPRHNLSEQLVWDAEHAPQNVGMSHNVLARTKQDGSDTVVEAITKVQSIDLVADPATTSGLYEHAAGNDADSEAVQSSKIAPSGAGIEAISLEQLRRERPELIIEIEQAYDAQLDQVRRRLDEMLAKEEASRRRERVFQLLQEFNLPLPSAKEGPARRIVSEEFLQSLMQAPTDAEVRSLIEARGACSVGIWLDDWQIGFGSPAPIKRPTRDSKRIKQQPVTHSGRICGCGSWPITSGFSLNSHFNSFHSGDLSWQIRCVGVTAIPARWCCPWIRRPLSKSAIWFTSIPTMQSRVRHKPTRERSFRINNYFTTFSPASRCRLREAATRNRFAWRQPAYSSSIA